MKLKEGLEHCEAPVLAKLKGSLDPDRAILALAPHFEQGPVSCRKRVQGSSLHTFGFSSRILAVVRDRVCGVQLHGTAGGVSFLGPENPSSNTQHKEEGV